MSFNSLAPNQMVTFTDAQTGGFTLQPGQSSVISNECVTKANANSKYILNTAFTDGYASNQLIPKEAWRNVPNTPVCSARIIAFQICNENSARDDNFDIFLNNVYIGAVNLNQNAQIGSVFIASLNPNITITSSDFPCPLSGMVIHRFNPGLLLSQNTLEMRNTQNNNNGNVGTIGIRNYILTGNNLSSPCVLLNLAYSGASGASFTKFFDYSVCCPIVNLTKGGQTANSVVLNWTTNLVGPSSYIVRQNDIVIASPAGNVNSLNVSGLTTGVSYNFTVQVLDPYGNLSVVSNILNHIALELLALEAPTNLIQTEMGFGYITAGWDNMPDAESYDVFIGGTLFQNVVSNSIFISTSECIIISVRSVAGINYSSNSNIVQMCPSDIFELNPGGGGPGLEDPIDPIDPWDPGFGGPGGGRR